MCLVTTGEKMGPRVGSYAGPTADRVRRPRDLPPAQGCAHPDANRIRAPPPTPPLRPDAPQQSAAPGRPPAPPFHGSAALHPRHTGFGAAVRSRAVEVASNARQVWGRTGGRCSAPHPARQLTDQPPSAPIPSPSPARGPLPPSNPSPALICCRSRAVSSGCL